MEDDAIEALMSARFESKKSKEWFERQIAIKKSTMQAEESKMAVEKIIKAQEVMKETAEYEASSEVTIIGNNLVREFINLDG